MVVKSLYTTRSQFLWDPQSSNPSCVVASATNHVDTKTFPRLYKTTSDALSSHSLRSFLKHRVLSSFGLGLIIIASEKVGGRLSSSNGPTQDDKSKSEGEKMIWLVYREAKFAIKMQESYKLKTMAILSPCGPRRCQGLRSITAQCQPFATS